MKEQALSTARRGQWAQVAACTSTKIPLDVASPSQSPGRQGKPVQALTPP